MPTITIWLLILASCIALYYFMVFVVSHLVFPNYGWRKKPLPTKISDQIQREIDALKQKYPSQDMFLRAAYESLAHRYEATFTVFFHIPSLFISNPDLLWNRKGKYASCHHINFLLRIFLVHSRLFKDDDIRVKYSMTEFVMTHQYLQVLIDGDWIDIDAWGIKYGVPFGSHAQGIVKYVPPTKTPR